MARVGKKVIQIPDKVKVSYADKCVTVTGSNGTLSRNLHQCVDLKIENGLINVTTIDNDRKTLAYQGLTRSLICNMIEGVNKKYERSLEVNGIGYKVEVKGNSVLLNIGFSHPIDFALPQGVAAKVEKNVLTLSSIDKELLGNTAASIRKLKPPEPYKGRGIKYTDEHIQRKAGKTA
jgi:large subunit ribosomal protein L6